MKMNKKKLAVVSLVLCIAAIISMGSLAWFTADDTVVNNLSFVTDFQMDLVEHEGSAEGTEVGTGTSQTGLTLSNLKPGSEVWKDPTVLNKSASEAQWIKMTVKVSKAAAWATAVPEGTDLTTIFTGYVDDLWFHPEDPAIEGTDYVATFYLKNKLAAGSSQALFTGIKIPETMTLDQAKAIEDCTITVIANAVQSDAGDDVLTAFAAAETANS